MRVLRWFIARPVRRATALWLAGMAVVPLAVAQRVQGAQAARAAQAGQSAQSAQAAQSANMAGPRFEEACQSAARSGRPMPGCGPAQSVPGNELEQLKQEALRTRNPQLMTMVGDAYQKGRAGMGDISQAYRWYVLGAVRGDPQAMARLSEIYRRGQGTAPDRVKAVGYAKLAQRVAPDSPAGKQAAQTVHALSKGMAQKELAQAERFAEELARQMGQGAGGYPAQAQVPWATSIVPGTVQASEGSRLPGAFHVAVQPGAGAASGGGTGSNGAGHASPAPATPTGLPAPGQMPGHAAVLPGQAAQAHLLPAAVTGMAAQAPTQPVQAIQPIDLRAPVVAAPAASAAPVAPAMAAPQQRPAVSPRAAARPQRAAPAPAASAVAPPPPPVILRPAVPQADTAEAPVQAPASSAAPAWPEPGGAGAGRKPSR